MLLPNIKAALATVDRPRRWTVRKVGKQLAKTDLLVLDDWGLESLTIGQRNDVVELMEYRHGSRSTLTTSQLAVQQCHIAIGDPTLVDAIQDRLLHNAHRLTLKANQCVSYSLNKHNQCDHY